MDDEYVSIYPWSGNIQHGSLAPSATLDGNAAPGYGNDPMSTSVGPDVLDQTNHGPAQLRWAPNAFSDPTNGINFGEHQQSYICTHLEECSQCTLSVAIQIAHLKSQIVNLSTHLQQFDNHGHAPRPSNQEYIGTPAPVGPQDWSDPIYVGQHGSAAPASSLGDFARPKYVETRRRALSQAQ